MSIPISCLLIKKDKDLSSQLFNLIMFLRLKVSFYDFSKCIDSGFST